MCDPVALRVAETCARGCPEASAVARRVRARARVALGATCVAGGGCAGCHVHVLLQSPLSMERADDERPRPAGIVVELGGLRAGAESHPETA